MDEINEIFKCDKESLSEEQFNTVYETQRKILRDYFQTETFNDIYKHAIEELKINGYYDEDNEEMAKLMRDDALEILKVLSSQEHTSWSIDFLMGMLGKLVKGINISELTGNEDEWDMIETTPDSFQMTLYRNKRNHNVIKKIDKEGVVTYIGLDCVRCLNVDTNVPISLDSSFIFLNAADAEKFMVGLKEDKEGLEKLIMPITLIKTPPFPFTNLPGFTFICKKFETPDNIIPAEDTPELFYLVNSEYNDVELKRFEQFKI